MIAVGIALNLARGNFGDTPLTASFALLGFGLTALTFRLMTATRREQRLSAEIADLKEYFIMAAVLAVFIVIMATYAAQVLA